MTITDIMAKWRAQTPVVMVTAYDYPFARLADQAGVDMILVGDSLGMVVQGEPDTLKVTMAHMLYHTRIVAKAVQTALVVADMPYGSVSSPRKALRNARLLITEGSANAVKIEGAGSSLKSIRTIVRHGILVMGHLGFTPQAIKEFGGYKIQGKSPEAIQKIIADGQELVAAGVFAIVLEMVPVQVGRLVQAALPVPVIGCGAGPDCAGQVLVMHDILGLSERQPSFAKTYIDLGAPIKAALASYCQETRAGIFPDEKHSFH